MSVLPEEVLFQGKTHERYLSGLKWRCQTADWAPMQVEGGCTPGGGVNTWKVSTRSGTSGNSRPGVQWCQSLPVERSVKLEHAPGLSRLLRSSGKAADVVSSHGQVQIVLSPFRFLAGPEFNYTQTVHW